MKVVLLHDWLTGFRGGERVLEALCEMFPDAPIYTLIHKKGSTSPIIESREIVTSFLDKIPGIYDNYRKFLPIMPLAAEMLKIKHDADLIISSSHCVIKGVRKPQGSKHISYVHSPMRYIYDQFDSYFGNASLPIKIAANICRPYLQWWDKRSNKNVDEMIANSEFVRKRIQKYYNIDAKVIHPFVDLKDFEEVQKNPPPKEDFYLMVTAFAPNKRVDLAIEAFNENGLTLKIIGGGSSQEELKLKQMANSNIEFLGRLSREEVIAYYAKAKAFIFPGVEDFGITPLESLAANTPVVAYKFGGVLETVDSKTGVFFQSSTPRDLNSSIASLSAEFKKEDLHSRANYFGKCNFKKSFNSCINNLL